MNSKEARQPYLDGIVKSKPRQEFIREAIESQNMSGVKFLEIGYHTGDIRRTMADFFSSYAVQYTAVDILEEHKGLDWYICKDSCDFWRVLPIDEKYHVIFVDGCHCESHPDVDVKGALLHLHLNGVLLIHDTGPSGDIECLQEYGGPGKAYLRNCVGRPELKSYIVPNHYDGIGIVVKEVGCGKDFLVETYESGLHYGCSLHNNDPLPPVEELFPLYFKNG